MVRPYLNGDDTYTPPRYQSTPKSRNAYNLTDTEMFISEWKFGFYGLLLSLIVILVKLYYTNGDLVKNAILEQRLMTYEVLTEDGDLMFKYVWKTVVKYSNIWLPILCGFITTYFTWIMVYLDSHQPGIQPPSPFSPPKYKLRSGHTFHLNYAFAVIIGGFVAIYMYWKNVSIIY